MQSDKHSMETSNRTPHADIHDPLEMRIRTLIHNEVESTPFGVDVVEKIRQSQKLYFKQALNDLESPEKIYKNTQDVLKDIAITANSRFIEGKDLLDQLPKGKPVFVALNHFGFNKLTTLHPDEIGLTDDEVTTMGQKASEIYPFPVYYAAIQPVAEVLEDNLSEAHLKMPGGKLPMIQKSAGLVVVPEEKGQFSTIVDRTVEVFREHPNSAMVIFPEGKTSGKSNQGSPYDLVPFHSGVWGIATEIAKTGLIIPVVTAYQYWNPNSGFEVGVIGVDVPRSDMTREEQNDLAENSRQKMQAALNARKSSK